MKTMREVCHKIGSVIVDNPICIETGTMYGCSEDGGVHNTTNNIIDFICRPKKGKLHSVDCDMDHIRFSREYNKQAFEENICQWHNDDSVEGLAWISFFLIDRSVDFLCLDSKEFDEDHMVNEYNAIKDRLSEKHFVLADDIHNPNSVKYKKMVPILKELGYTWLEVPTPTGLFLGYKGYVL